jgi:hypothetical protein
LCDTVAESAIRNRTQPGLIGAYFRHGDGAMVVASADRALVRKAPTG